MFCQFDKIFEREFVHIVVGPLQLIQQSFNITNSLWASTLKTVDRSENLRGLQGGKVGDNIVYSLIKELLGLESVKCLIIVIKVLLETLYQIDCIDGNLKV